MQKSKDFYYFVSLTFSQLKMVFYFIFICPRSFSWFGYMCCLLDAMLATILHFCYVHAITCNRSKKEYGIQEKFKITYDNIKLFQVFHIANMVFSHVQNLTIFSTKMYVHWLSNSKNVYKMWHNIFFIFCVQNGSMGRD
jgi:hypothetical protein